MTTVLPSKSERVRFDLTLLGLPEVSCVGIYEMMRAERYMEDEHHPSELELVYVKRGDFAYPVAGKTYHVRAGEMLVIHPGEQHGGVGHVLERCVHYWMKFRVRGWKNSFLGLDATHSKLLLRSLRRLPCRQFEVADGVEELFEDILNSIQNNQGQLRRVAIACRIVAWLTLVIESAHRPSTTAITPEVEKAARWIQENSTEQFDLEAFAEHFGISSSGFRRKFRVEMGVPIHDYQMEIKVGEARKMLSEASRSITEIAFSLGFSSSQYFSTVFKRYTTQTPSEFRLAAERQQ